MSDMRTPCPPGPPVSGAAISRSFTINFHCNKDLAPGELVILGVDEPTQCRYVADAESVASCACEPNCTHKLCGPDGCGGSCSGAGFALPDGCPVDYVNNRYVPQVRQRIASSSVVVPSAHSVALSTSFDYCTGLHRRRLLSPRLSQP